MIKGNCTLIKTWFMARTTRYPDFLIIKSHCFCWNREGAGASSLNSSSSSKGPRLAYETSLPGSIPAYSSTNCDDRLWVLPCYASSGSYYGSGNSSTLFLSCGWPGSIPSNGIKNLIAIYHKYKGHTINKVDFESVYRLHRDWLG